jgi:hypothetical protein
MTAPTKNAKFPLLYFFGGMRFREASLDSKMCNDESFSASISEMHQVRRDLRFYTLHILIFSLLYAKIGLKSDILLKY